MPGYLDYQFLQFLMILGKMRMNVSFALHITGHLFSTTHSMPLLIERATVLNDEKQTPYNAMHVH